MIHMLNFRPIRSHWRAFHCASNSDAANSIQCRSPFPITELEAQKIRRSIQTSGCVSDSISAGARKHDFHYQKITALRQGHWDQDLTSTSLTSLLSNSRHVIARGSVPLCWRSFLLWRTLYEMISKKCILALLLTCKNWEWGWWRTSNWPLL